MKPSAVADNLLLQIAGGVRFVYNNALEQRKEHHRNYKRVEGHNISQYTQMRELTLCRADPELVFLKEGLCDAQQNCLKDLHKNFDFFFKKLGGYPKPRKRGVNDSFRIPASRLSPVKKLNKRWAEIWVPKVGNVKFRMSRKIEGEIINATFSRNSLGWHVSFQCEVKAPKEDMSLQKTCSPLKKKVVGIDMGCATHMTLSNGEFLSLPSFDKDVERYKHWQRKMARGKRKSKRYTKAKRELAKVAAKAARKRRHWQHQVTSKIAKEFDVVCFEDLKIKNMTASARGTVEEPGTNVRQKAGLNRSILHAAWGQARRFLEYKMERKGGSAVAVPAAYTSRTCNACGHVAAENRKSQAVFVCVRCGHEDHADLNAAKNIKTKGAALLAGLTQPAGKVRRPRKATPDLKRELDGKVLVT